MTAVYVREQTGVCSHYQKMAASDVLRHWLSYNFADAQIIVRPHQPDPAWPKIERLLRRNGWQPEQPLTYRQVQALAAWQEVDLCWWLPPENDQRTGGQSTGQSGDQSGDQSGAQSGGQSGAQSGGQSGDQSGGQSGAQSGGQSGDQSGGQANGRSGARRNGYGTQGGNRRTRLWTPWPEPNKRLVRLAERTLQAVQVELVESAREALPLSWNYRRLAVRQEMGQLDAGRRWERLGVPRLLIGLDFSGSMGGFVAEVAALGATLAHVFPWLVVAAAPNAALEPLTTVGDKQIIADGRWEALPEGLPPEQENNAAQWRMIDATWPVTAAIYVGDWEAWRMADAFAGRFGVLSVYQARNGAPIRTDHAYGEPTPYPTVTRCNTADDFLEALRMIMPALLR